MNRCGGCRWRVWYQRVGRYVCKYPRGRLEGQQVGPRRRACRLWASASDIPEGETCGSCRWLVASKGGYRCLLKRTLSATGKHRSSTRLKYRRRENHACALWDPRDGDGMREPPQLPQGRSPTAIDIAPGEERPIGITQAVDRAYPRVVPSGWVDWIHQREELLPRSSSSGSSTPCAGGWPRSNG